jgi:hypothetical protein
VLLRSCNHALLEYIRASYSTGGRSDACAGRLCRGEVWRSSAMQDGSILDVAITHGLGPLAYLLWMAIS